MSMDKATKQISDLLFAISNVASLPIERNFNSDKLTSFCANNYPLVIGILLCYGTFY